MAALVLRLHGANLDVRLFVAFVQRPGLEMACEPNPLETGYCSLDARLLATLRQFRAWVALVPDIVLLSSLLLSS